MKTREAAFRPVERQALPYDLAERPEAANPLALAFNRIRVKIS
jgi:hypothetical protein